MTSRQDIRKSTGDSMPQEAKQKCQFCGAGLRRQFSYNGTCDGECYASLKSIEAMKFVRAVMRPSERV